MSSRPGPEATAGEEYGFMNVDNMLLQ